MSTATELSSCWTPTHREDALGPVVAVVGRVLRIAATAMLILAAAGFLLLAVGPRVLGYQTSTMLTGSMAPLINPGDVVITVPIPIADLHEGDVIAYHIPVEDHRVETHRVVGLAHAADGHTEVNTKGDANGGADPWTATLAGETVYRQVATIPFLGQAIRLLREPPVRTVLMYGAPAVLVLGLLASIWRKDADRSAGSTDA